MKQIHSLYAIVLMYFSFNTFASEQTKNDFISVGVDIEKTIIKYKKSSIKRIVIVPFDDQTSPISESIANKLNDKLSEILLKRNKITATLVARSDIHKVLNDMENHSDDYFYNNKNISNLLTNIKDIDIFIIGKLRLIGNQQIGLMYKVISNAGEVLTVTSEIQQNLSTLDTFTLGKTYTLAQASNQIAKSLKNAFPNLTTIVKNGIYYQDTRVHSALGRYIQNKTVESIEKEFSNNLTNQHVKVRGIEPNYNTDNFRGMEITAKAQQQSLHEYNFTGTYWVFDGAIELSVNVRDKDGRSQSWSGFVNLNSLPSNLKLRPAALSDHNLIDNDGIGATQIYLSTNKGDDPIFKVGEKAKFLLKVNRPSWVYCFYRSQNGDTIQIVPNPYFKQYSETAFFEANTPHVIPQGNKYPFDIEITKPLGVEILKCFALNKNIESKFPVSLTGQSFDTIPRKYSANLSNYFRTFKNVAVSENSVVVTVVED